MIYRIKETSRNQKKIFMFTGRKYFMSDKSNLNQKQKDSQAQIINAKTFQNIFQKKSREKVNAKFCIYFCVFV